jgi:hypothetical protein
MPPGGRQFIGITTEHGNGELSGPEQSSGRDRIGGATTLG